MCAHHTRAQGLRQTDTYSSQVTHDWTPIADLKRNNTIVLDEQEYSMRGKMLDYEKTKISRNFLLQWNRERERTREARNTQVNTTPTTYMRKSIVRLHKQNKFYHYNKYKKSTNRPVFYSVIIYPCCSSLPLSATPASYRQCIISIYPTRTLHLYYHYGLFVRVSCYFLQYLLSMVSVHIQEFFHGSNCHQL